MAGASPCRRDDPAIGAFVVRGLREAGYTVDHALEGHQGFALARRERFDAIVLDLMLPGRDGLSILEGLRGAGVRTPVLILTARRSVDERVRGCRPAATTT